MFRLLVSLLFCFSALALAAQMTFKKRLVTPQNDRAFCVEPLPDNSFLLGGSSGNGGLGGDDAMLIKLSADGTVEWTKVFGGSGFEEFFRILACSDGNYLAVGGTNSMGAGGYDIYMVKFDLGGNVLWERTSGGGAQELIRGVCEVGDGYIVTAASQSYGSGNYDIYVEKVDFAGNSVWSKVWGTAGTDYGGDPIPASGGDVWVAGYVTNGTNNDGVLLRISSAGTLISATRVGGAMSENMFFLTTGGPGLAQSGASWSSTQFQPWLFGMNQSGAFVWGKRYLIPSGNYDAKVEDCPIGGGFIFTPTNLSATVAEIYLVKTDYNGNITWAKTYTMSGAGRTFQARQTPDGGYVAVGYCNGAMQDVFIVKTDASGNVQGCCPVDAAIVAEAINPPSAVVSLPNATASSAVSAAGQTQAIALEEIPLCSGSSCCVTDAGTMVPQTKTVCINLPATFTHNGDEELDANDLLQFILFSDLNDTLGSIVAVSNTPTFTFNPATMQTGVTYYVAAIAGNNVGGNVDLTDPCLDISNAALLIWLPLPSVTFTVANPNVCAGECTTVTATFTGSPPFTLTYTVNGTSPVTQIFPGFSGTFQVCVPAGAPPGSFMLQAIALSDAKCTCE